MTYPRRDVVDAIGYLVRTGCQWDALPVDFPPAALVKHYFTAWTRDGTLSRAHNTLREQVRQVEGRSAEPTAALVDSQTVRGSDTVPRTSRGYDAGKRANGRKRHIVTDTCGWLLAVLVTGAHVPDRDAGHTPHPPDATARAPRRTATRPTSAPHHRARRPPGYPARRRHGHLLQGDLGLSPAGGQPGAQVKTHDCYYHSLTTRRGELAGKDVHVTIAERDTGTVLVDEVATTFDNGFVGFWLPSGIDATITVAYEGYAASSDISTGPDAPTCLTTVKLVPAT